MKTEKTVAVIDLGGQYAHLIASKIRSMGFYSVIKNPEDENLSKYGGIILSGSPSLSAFDELKNSVSHILDYSLPVLGFCFGHQEIAKHYGGEVVRGKQEFGEATLEIVKNSIIFKDIPKKSKVWMSHGDSVVKTGEGFSETGITYSDNSKIHHYAAICDEKRSRYGFQFHPEVDDSEFGNKMIFNFVKHICKIEENWDSSGDLDNKIEEIKNSVGDKKVFLLVSGGVDSTVLGELLIKALKGNQVHLLHIDPGFMRLNESNKVKEIFNNIQNFHFADYSELFFENLNGVIEPEKKRVIIGETFVKVCEKEIKKLDLAGALRAQGTIYPDTVESGGTKRGKVIKTHHNRVKLMEEMIAQGKVIEPLKNLYKTEVRALGAKLSIDSELINRHPFPGPGLAVRILCSDGEFPHDFSKVQIDKNRYGKNLDLKLLPVASVGVKADCRSYELPLLVQGGENQKEVQNLVSVFVKEIMGINRVIWNLGEKINKFLPSKRFLTKNRVELLQKIDFIVNTQLVKMNLMKKVWQFPVVLLPLNMDGEDSEAVILRPVQSVRAMTAIVPYLPKEFYEKIYVEIMNFKQIKGVFLDLTTKPPGTIEWE
jgi:GMP synthase (glutamine-hydrolysing)